VVGKNLARGGCALAGRFNGKRLSGRSKIRRPFKNGEMQGSGKSQGAQCIANTKAVWLFPLTPQIAVLGRPASG